MSTSLKQSTLNLGVCYYPEQWEESLWEEDFRRMRDMCISVIRIGEFGWSIIEPEEGVYCFDFFDRVVALASSFGMKIIMGTPTATPPAWLTELYPEVLNATQEGIVFQHGGRRHYNYSSEKYREFCANITSQLAEHYKDHPAIIGWQIDNELNCEVNVFYSEEDHRLFRKWLKDKYENLEKLNHAWGTVFWNQTYSDWSQVHLLRPNASNSPNPHQALDEKRFISDNTISFAQLQSTILRSTVKRQWITTNTLFGHLDYHKLTNETLDFLSYDSYPLFSTVRPEPGQDPLLDRKWSMNLSVVRSVSPNFCVMEQQAGAGGWVNRVAIPSPRPGQIRLWTYQSIAHGADMVTYFRWRTATVGTEMYWHGINDHHNQPNRRMEEVKLVGSEIVSIGDKIIGTKYEAKVAIMRDYDNEWDGELDNWHGPMDRQSVLEWYKALQYSHVPTDFIYINEESKLMDLLKYDLIVYPHPAIMTKEIAELVAQYVVKGGTIIYGCRTGYKNELGHCNMAIYPGPIADLCGISIEDFTHVIPNENPTNISFNNDEVCYNADLFNEILRPESSSVEVEAEYTSKYYKGKPALTKNKVGHGFAWYYGAAFNQKVVYEILKRINMVSPIDDICDLPKEIELSIRQSKEKKIYFLLNYSSDSVEIMFKQRVKDILTNQCYQGNVALEPYGVIIIEEACY